MRCKALLDGLLLLACCRSTDRLCRRSLQHREVPSGILNQFGKLRTIGNVGISNFDAGYDVRCRSAHQMDFDPFVPIHQGLVAVLCFDPLCESASREAGRIDSERRFDGLQRQAANLNQLFERWR